MPGGIRSALWRAAPWLILAAAAWIGIAGILPPAAVGAAAPAENFSAERAFAHIEAIARQDRPIGSPGNAAARDYLVGELREMGVTVDLQRFSVPDYYGDGGDPVTLVNIVGLIPGTDSTGSIVLMGHYDTYPGAPGANDAAAAIATVLEAGRAVLAGSPRRNDIILLLTDGEEPAPRYGSTEFVARHPLAAAVGLVVNFEAVGGAGASELIETSGAEGRLLAEYAGAVPHPVAFSYFADLVDLLGGSDTDFAPFRDAGIPGFHFSYVHGSPIYHTADDDPGSVRLSSLQHHGSHALALARHFGDLDLGRYRGGGYEVYFSLMGRVVIRYPALWGIALVLFTGVLLGWVLMTEHRARRLSLPRVAAGAGALLGVAVGAAMVTDLLWRLVLAVLWRDRGPGVAAALAVLVVLLAVAATLAFMGHRRLTRRIGSSEMETGGTLIWWLMALAASLLLPGAGYVFAWPALAATLATGVGERWGWAASGWWQRLGAPALVAVPTVILSVPLIDTLYQLGQPRPGNLDSQLLDVVALVGLVSALAAGLLVPYLRRAAAAGLSR